MPDYKLRIIVEGVDKASSVLKGVGGALGNIGQIAAGVGVGNLLSGAVEGLAGAARGALDSYAAYERLGQSINSLAAKEALLTGQATSMQDAMAQTAGKSKELLGWVQKLAIESPFKQEDVASAFRLSMALGFGTAEAQRLTQAMLNFSTATGAGGDTIERVARALGQMRTKGRVSLEEVNQLTESGVDAMRILSDATGLTGKALTDAISKGAVDANSAIEAIIKDTERLYANAGKNSAESMSGLLSTLSEIGELSGRNLLAGVFQAAQPYIADVVGLLMAPEFQAGLQNWGNVLGGFTVAGLEGAAAAMERVDAAVTPLLDKGAPPWLVALQGFMALGDYTLDVKIAPEVTTIKTPDGGLTMDVTATAATITSADGGLFKVDVEAQIVSLDADTTDDMPPVQLVADWKQGTIGSLIAADWSEDDAEQHKILVKAGWQEGAIDSLMTLLNVNDWLVNVQPVLDAANNPGGFGFNLGEQLIGSVDWEQYKADWSAALATWQPALTGLNTAIDSVVTGYQGLVTLDAGWKAGMAETLFDAIQTTFNDPITLYGSWFANTLTDLWGAVQGWFTANPVSVSAQATVTAVEYGTEHAGHGNFPRKSSGRTAPIDVTQPSPETYIDPVTGKVMRRAKGGPAKGWTVVGEEGPELAFFGGGGAHILSNPDSVKLLQSVGVPGFADGTTTIPPWLERALSSVGLWVDQSSPQRQMGPPTRDDAYGGWRNFQQKGVEAMQGAAQQTGDAFEQAAEDVNDTFKGVLQGVPGLFGTSQVTGDQMRMAELGVPQNFADDYLRRLSDEVLNGVDWEGVDVKDAAARAGIDPNLPAEVILELFRNAWNDSSLFANPANLDLVNQDAVKAAIEQQQKELTGKANLMQLFGITDENLQEQSDALGAGLASVFGKASESDAMKAAGVSAFAAIGEGFGDSNTAVTAVGGMAQAVVTATGTPENQTALEDAGKAAASAYYGGWKSFMAEATPPAPTGDATSTPPVTPPGNAMGTANWRGGWTVVGEHGPELVDLPPHSRIQDANATRRWRGRAARATVVNQTFVVNDKLMAEQAAQRAVQLIRRGV